MSAPLNATFIHRQTTAGQVRFTTTELGELEAKIANAADRALAIEFEIFDRLAASVAAGPAWRGTLPEDRAGCLEKAAELMEAQMQPLIGLVVREAGKTYANAVGEVREAVDFLRYYAQRARLEFGRSSVLLLVAHNQGGTGFVAIDIDKT